MKLDDYTKLMKLLEESVKEHSDDLFRVRIVRKNNATDLPVQWATFRNVQLRDLDSPERWLSKLADGGGGFFEMMIAHEKRTAATLGTLSVTIQGPATNPSRAALSQPNYDGPQQADFLVGELPQGSPPLPARVNTQLPNPQQPTYQTSARLGDLRLEEENKQLRERLERSERRLEREELERKHKDDMDALERRLSALVPAKQSGESDMVKLMLEQGRQQAEITREMIRSQQEESRRSEDRMMKVVEGLTSKKSDPLQEKLLTMALDGESRHAKQFESVGLMTTQVSQAAMQMMTHQVEMMRQLNPGDENDGMIRLGEKMVDAFMASRGGVDAPLVPENKQLPPGAPPHEDESDVSAEDAQEAFEAMQEAVKAKKRAHEILPAVLVALHGNPLRALMQKHKGDMGDVVTELFGKWVQESFGDRMAYVQKELVKVEMSLVALGVVRASKALQTHLAEQAAATEAQAKRQKAAPPRPPAPPPPVSAKARSSGPAFRRARPVKPPESAPLETEPAAEVPELTATEAPPAGEQIEAPADRAPVTA